MRGLAIRGIAYPVRVKIVKGTFAQNQNGNESEDEITKAATYFGENLRPVQNDVYPMDAIPSRHKVSIDEFLITHSQLIHRKIFQPSVRLYLSISNAIVQEPRDSVA